jgi:hypothetical protein
MMLLSLEGEDCISPEAFVIPQAINVLLSLVPPLQYINWLSDVERR